MQPSPDANFTFETKNMPGQKRFMESQADWLLYSGSFGAGKSKVGCEKIHFLSLKYPRNFCAILRKTYSSLRHTTMRTFFNTVCHPDYIKNYNKETHTLTYINDSEVIFIGLDSDVKIGSMELGAAFVDEGIEVSEDIWIMLDGRVGRLPHIPFSQLMAATNPASNTHYLYKYFFKIKDPSWEVIEANSLENPHLTESYRNKLSKYTGRYKERYVYGRWVGYEGLVYDNVDLNNFLVPNFLFPASWHRYRAIDFGYSNPFVCQWWVEVPEDDEWEPEEGFEPDDSCECSEEDKASPFGLHHYTRCLGFPLKGSYMYREVYMSKRLVETHAVVINALSRDEQILETFADHDAEGRATLEERGILTSPARKSIANGIQTVHQLIEQDLLHFFEDTLVEQDFEMAEEGKRPTRSAEEFGNYSWMELPNNRNNKEIPQDRDNHGMDAMRYYAYTRFGDLSSGELIYKRKEVLDYFHQVRGGQTEERNWQPYLERDRNWRKVNL